MVRGGRILFLCAFAACHGGGPSIADAGPYASAVDASRDAAGDATVDAGSAADASMDAGPSCATDSDCHDVVDSVCLGGHCAPGVCFSSDPVNYGCPAGFDCIGSRCLPPACGECPSGEVCDPAIHGCAAPVDAVTCRAAGGLYVRGRCLRADTTEPTCDGGFASETVPGSCDAPTLAGANLDTLGIVRVGPFPIAKVESPVAGTLVGTRLLTRSGSLLWRFSYVDASVLGGAAEASLRLTPQGAEPDRVSCVAPVSDDFAPTPLCHGVPLESAFDCDDLAIEAVIGDREGALALAGRDAAGLLHVDLLGMPTPGVLTVQGSYVSAEPSELWRPLGFNGVSVRFRVGMAAPLSVVGIGGPTVDARLSTGPEFVQNRESPYDLLALDVHGALVSIRGDRVAPVLSASAPVGPYAAGQRFIGHVSLPLPSTLRVYRRVAPGTVGAPDPVELFAEEANVGLALDTHLGRQDSVVAAVPLASGGWGVDEISFPVSGASIHRPLIRPVDVGGTILAVTDLSAGGRGDYCGDLTVLPETLYGAMLDIRLADDSVVHELWAVAIKGW